MELFILRHAIAVPHGTRGYERDGERPLTPKGEKRMKQIAEVLRALDLSFDLLLSSPLTRARQTAEIVARAFDAKTKLKFTEHLAVGGDPRALVDEVAATYGSFERVMLVGHEPYLSDLIAVLLSGEATLSITMKKGGLCKLTVDALHYGRCATLEWLLTPGVMARIG